MQLYRNQSGSGPSGYREIITEAYREDCVYREITRVIVNCDYTEAEEIAIALVIAQGCKSAAPYAIVTDSQAIYWIYVRG